MPYKTIQRQEYSQKQLFQDHFTTDDVHDIMAMKKAFSKSYDHVGNIPGTYTIRLDPSVPPAQHARRKVRIEYKEQIEKALQQMEDLKIITPVIIPTEWGLIHYISKKTRWNSMHMFRPKRSHQSNY